MNLPFFIAGRYLVSKKSRNVINLISWVSILGITVGTTALIIVLSVFNGLESLVKSLYNAFDPDLRIALVEGKTFSPDESGLQQAVKHESVAVFSEVLEENALLDYRKRQAIVTMKGVSDNYNSLTEIDSLIVDGSFQLFDGDIPAGIIGYDLALQLGIGLNFIDPLFVYVPGQASGLVLNPNKAFNKDHLYPRGIFSVQQEYDSQYLIVPISFARDLIHKPGMVTSIDIRLHPGEKPAEVKKELEAIVGQKYQVETRDEQHEAFYKVMKSEKFAIFAILGFILIIASFNTISSLTLLVLEKKKDMHILQSMGALPRLIRKIFLTEGLLITGLGLLAGLLLGAGVCWAQITFGMIRFPSNGSFIVDVYPLKMVFSDFLWVGLLVGIIGWIAAVIPVRVLGKRYFSSFNGTELNT